MTLLTIVHKASLKAGLDAGDHPFINVALTGFAASGLDINVDQSLTFDDCYPSFFGVGRVQ